LDVAYRIDFVWLKLDSAIPLSGTVEISFVDRLELRPISPSRPWMSLEVALNDVNAQVCGYIDAILLASADLE
jgi:hypothetical protein